MSKELYYLGGRSYFKFGGTPYKLPRKVVIWLHGAFQTNEDTWWDYLNFRKMSEAEKWASDDVVMLLPQGRGRLWYVPGDAHLIHDLAQYHQATEGLYLFGFSLGATYGLWLNTYVNFTGIATCGAIVPYFTNLDTTAPQTTQSYILQGLDDRKKNVVHAAKINKWHLQHGVDSKLDYISDMGHRWPAHKNEEILRYFDIIV